MSKPQSSFTLRFKSPLDYPYVAKFADPIDWQKAEKPVKMYFREEEVKEEEEVNVVKDAEYYKRKRGVRRNYRKKNTLVLEDSSASAAPVTGAVDASAPAATGVRFEGRRCNLGLADIEDANSREKNQQEAPFRYVLLQFVKQTDGASCSEINVIPVGDMFSMKRASLLPDELMADVEERYIDQQQRTKDAISRYKGLGSSLLKKESDKLEEGDNFMGFDSNSIFGNAVAKAMGGKKGRKAEEKPDADAKGNGFLNENGVDMEEMERDIGEYGGDYTTRYADDEEDQVVFEQQRLNEHEATELSGAQRYDENLGEDEGEEEEEEALRAEEEEAGMVDSHMVENAAEARKVFRLPGKLKTKRPREEFEADSGGVGGKAVEVGGGVPKKSEAPKGGEDFSLSEEGVRAFMLSKGGRVSYEDLRYFKPAIKALGRERGSKQAGSDRFFDILGRVTDEHEDHILGRVVVLKKK